MKLFSFAVKLGKLQYFGFYKMRVFLCIRKVYVLSRNENSESHWMTFDIDTQHWKVFNNDLSSRCYGSILNIRNVHYFFSDMCEKVHKILFFVHMILLLAYTARLVSFSLSFGQFETRFLVDFSKMTNSWVN